VLALIFNLEDILDPDLGLGVVFKSDDSNFEVAGYKPWEYVTLLFSKILVIFLLLLASSFFRETTQLLEVFAKI
jgi:hypothetical protein